MPLILLAHPDAEIYGFDPPRIKKVRYEDTARFQLYKQFFTDRTVFLRG